MTTTTKGTTMTTPESPAAPVFAPHSPATGAEAPAVPGNGTDGYSDGRVHLVAVPIRRTPAVFDPAISEPLVHRSDAGALTLHWPLNYPDFTQVSLPLLEEMVATHNELAALKARRCDGCEHYVPPTEYDVWFTTDATGDTIEQPDQRGWCDLGQSVDGRPVAADAPMWAADGEMYSAALRVLPDHACNAWQPKAGQ